MDAREAGPADGQPVHRPQPVGGHGEFSAQNLGLFSSLHSAAQGLKRQHEAFMSDADTHGVRLQKLHEIAGELE